MARKKKGGGSGDGGFGGAMAPVNQGLSDWNLNANQWAGDAINYGQNNPNSAAGTQYIQKMLSGNAPNKWSDSLYGDLDGVNMNESMDYLRDFLGGGSGSGGSGGAGSGGVVFKVPKGYGSHGKSVKIQDSSMGKGAFQDTAQYILDREHRLNPEDDPTLAPYIDAIQREAQESYERSANDLSSNLSGDGLWGGSHYDALMQYNRDDSNENTTNAIAGVYQGSRDKALDNIMQMMGLGNERDIAQGQMDVQMAGINSSGASSAAASRGADQDRRLQAIQMMMQGGQFGLGLKGNMSELLQNGQQGALEAGLGYGQLGMSGYDTAGNMGQLGIGALNSLGSNLSNYYNSQYSRQASERANQFARERYNDEKPWTQSNRMIDLLRNLGSLSGDYDMPAYNPYPQDNGGGGNEWLDALLSGGGAGMEAYFNNRNQR